VLQFNFTEKFCSVVFYLFLDNGNSLCHSVSIHVYGIPDTFLFLRICLYSTCKQHSQIGSPLHAKFLSFKKSKLNQNINPCSDQEVRDPARQK